METTDTLGSCRVQGLPPEFGPLAQKTHLSTKPTMSTQSSQTPAAAFPVVYLPVDPRTPITFQCEIYEHVQDWLQRYERVALQTNGLPNSVCRTSIFLPRNPGGALSKSMKRRLPTEIFSRQSLDEASQTSKNENAAKRNCS